MRAYRKLLVFSVVELWIVKALRDVGMKEGRWDPGLNKEKNARKYML
jgi:hypothetical protein